MQPFQFCIIKNTVKQTNLSILKDLTHLKNLYSRQLSRMPRQYIVKLLFDTVHQSIVIKTNNTIVAGVTFRGFTDKPFYEIAFLAVNKQNQQSGLGSKVMNRFKNHCQSQDIRHVFTFADDGAIEFFEKHGFSKQISLPEKQYKPYIKEYIGGQLMECKLNLELKIDFEKLKSQLKATQQIVVNHQVRPLLSLASYDLERAAKIIKQKEKQKQCKSLSEIFKFIPGIKEAGYSKENFKDSEKQLNLPFLLNCQQFIDLAFAKAIILNDALQYENDGKLLQTPENIEKQNIEKEFYFLLYHMQRKLRFGHYKYKDEFMEEFTSNLKKIIRLDSQIRQHEKEFLDKINQLKYEFMKNTLPHEKLKSKTIEIPKFVRTDQRR